MPRKHIIKSDPYTACEAKVKYADEENAEAAASYMRAFAQFARPLRPYRCPHCTGWHLSKRNMGE